MKTILVLILAAITNIAFAQKYILLDQHLSQPAVYSDEVSASYKFREFFPVETTQLKSFIAALEEIVVQLKTGPVAGKLKQYKMGCVKFTGIIVPVKEEQRLDYVITFKCDGIDISMHICDAGLKNSANAYFINTWLKYIRRSVASKN